MLELKSRTKVLVRNKKDELFNDILLLIEKEGLVWKVSEDDNGTASNAVATLREALWYVDRHHHTLADRNCYVPHVFLLGLLNTTTLRDQSTKTYHVHPCVLIR